MRIRILAAALAAGVACAVPVAKGAVLTFDDINTNQEGFIPNGYGGLNWNNFAYENGTTYGAPLSGYANGRVSGDYVAFNAFANQAITSGSPFTFNSAYFTAAWHNGLNITVTGYLAGNQVDQTTFTVNTTGPTLEVFNWVNVDQLVFNSSGGVNPGNLGGDGDHFAMDNFAFDEAVNAAPLPSSAIAGLGLFGLLSVAQFRRRLARS